MSVILDAGRSPSQRAEGLSLGQCPAAPVSQGAVPRAAYCSHLAHTSPVRPGRHRYVSANICRMPRRYTHEEASAIMTAAGLVVLTEYPGAHRPWPSCCMTCGRVAELRLCNIQAGHGCRRCARPRATCSIEGCGRPGRGLGYCSKHYERFRKNGDPHLTKKVAVYTPGTGCGVEGCGKPVLARGWCSAHYQRWKLHDDPLGGGPRQRVRRALDHDDDTRTCPVCDQRKPLEAFPLDKNSTLGRKAKCKLCHTTQAKGWYANNRARQSELQRKRYWRDVDVIRERDKLRYERDKPKRLALVIDAGNRRRARLRHDGPWDRGITHSALRKRDGDHCCYCRVVMDFSPGDGRTFRSTRATVEHVIPIALGGTHTWDNVTLACWQCNLRKNRTLLEDWLPAGKDIESLNNDAS